MNKVFILLKALIYNTFSINEIVNNNKNRTYTILMGIGIFLLVLFISAYNVMTALTLVKIQQQSLIPSYMVSVASFIIVIFNVLCANGVLFGTNDYCMLAALPIERKYIIGSKFTFMYLISFILCTSFMIPAGIVWIYSTTVNVWIIIIYFFGVVFIPIAPMCIALSMGIIIIFFSSRFRNGQIFSLALSLLILGCLAVVVFYSNESGISGGSMGIILIEQVSRLYPPSALFIYNSSSTFHYIVIFYFISLGLLGITIKVASENYIRLNSMMLKNVKKARTKIKHKKKSQLVAMYKKEVGRFLSSYIYMLNTGLGVFTLIAVSILLCLFPISVITEFMGIEEMYTLLKQFSPIIIASMLTMSCTTSSAISLEGKSIQILKSIPLEKRNLINAKILFNLSVHSIAYVLSIVVFILRFDLNFIQSILIVIIPAAYSVYISVLGIYINIKFPKFDWENEVMVIKQSMSVILTSLIGLIE